jgi:hypothetical protein
MRMEPERQDWAGWNVHVTDEAQSPVLDLSFAEAD